MRSQRHLGAVYSWVYLMRADDLGAVKIGVARRPLNRLKEIQTGCPAEVVILGAFLHEEEKAYELEKLGHNLFAAFQLHGEWFSDEGILGENGGKFIKGISRDCIIRMLAVDWDRRTILKHPVVHPEFQRIPTDWPFAT